MNHSEKVQQLQAQFLKINGHMVLAKKTSNLFRPLEKSNNKLNVDDFNEVLSVSDDGIADVEGMVSFEKLVSETLKHGFVPQVSVEFKTITVGGAVSGTAIGSSSFKYGLFHQTIEEMEVIVPTGEIIVCSREENSDLFFALPNSYGTLGYILRLKIKLVKAKKYVQLKYTKYNNSKSCLDELGKLSKATREYDFVEGVVFGKNEMILSVGKFVDEAPYTSDYTYMKVYYKSLRERTEDYLETEQFLFRWDPDWWWGSIPLLRLSAARLLFGKWLLHSKYHMKYFRLTQKYNISRKILLPQELIIQDIGIPPENWKKYLDFLLDDINILPMWLCPFKSVSDFKLFPSENKIYIDFGFWGGKKIKGTYGYWNKLVEQKTFELSGIKSLYSDVYYTEDDFWKNSNREAYKKVKTKYDPKGKFKGLYKKVTRK